MPSARKSNVSIVTNGETESPAPASKSKQQLDGMSVEDLNLPKTMINRLAKGVLPSNTQIQKDALLALSKSATVFINYIAAGASEWATTNGKKTISPNDVYAALQDYEYHAFLPRVQAEVSKYNEVQCDKRNSYRRRVKADKAAIDPDGKDTDAMDETDAAISEAVANGKRSGEDEPPSKKIRREPGDEVDDGDEDGEDEGADEEPEEDDEEEEEDGEEVEEEEAEDDDQAEEGMREDDDDMVTGEIRDEALDEPDSD